MKKEKLYELFVQLIYLSFAFDSLLKLNISIKLHIGIILILGLNIMYVLTHGWKNKFKIPSQDIWLFLFGVYIFFNGLIKTGTSSLFLFFYFFLAINVYVFISLNFDRLKENTFFTFQKVLIVTGLFQFILYLVFDYQINFLDIDHYSKGSSVNSRIRGFFVEPNWFAIALTFNSFILIKNDIVSFAKKHSILFTFTILVMLLNGSIGTFVIFIGIYGYKFFKKNIVFGVFLLLIGITALTLILNKRAEIKKNKEGLEIFNYYSRLEPIKRVSNYFETQPLHIIFFGEGFGSWGTKAVENRLSVLVYKTDPSSRDGSELPVYIFELGYFGLALFLMDWIILLRRNKKENYYITGALFLFLICFFLYPIFKFLMYMGYYFVIRMLIRNNRIILKDKLTKQNEN